MKLQTATLLGSFFLVLKTSGKNKKPHLFSFSFGIFSSWINIWRPQKYPAYYVIYFWSLPCGQTSPLTQIVSYWQYLSRHFNIFAWKFLQFWPSITQTCTILLNTAAASLSMLPLRWSSKLFHYYVAWYISMLDIYPLRPLIYLLSSASQCITHHLYLFTGLISNFWPFLLPEGPFKVGISLH